MTYNKRQINTKYHQGFYNPQNPNKYIGDLSCIKFNSSWEYKFMVFCDTEPDIVRWGSELDNMVVVYEIPDLKTGVGKKHRYYPDFYIEVRTNNPNVFYRYVIEIKPYKETIRPEPPKKYTAKALESYEYKCVTYNKNALKWAYAKEYFKNRGMSFIVLDETFFDRYGLVKIF